MINVLDKGYVHLVDKMGSDLSVVNAARVSYDRESQKLNEKDRGLLNFLVRENHPAPFRHAICTYEIYAPLIVKNQWFKHLIGGMHYDDAEFPGLDPFFAWNESSRRYITEKEEFYLPPKAGWRAKPANSKQGSGDALPYLVDDNYRTGVSQGEDLSEYGNYWTQELEIHYIACQDKYRRAMLAGIAPEQARLFLPAYALYVRWRWTTSLQGVMWFLKLRDEAHAQQEIRDYAVAVKTLTAVPFPATMEAMDG